MSWLTTAATMSLSDRTPPPEDFASTLPVRPRRRRKSAEPSSAFQWILSSRFGCAGHDWLMQLLEGRHRSRGAVPLPVAELRRLLRASPRCARELPGLAAVLRAVESAREDPLQLLDPDMLQRALGELKQLPEAPERGLHLLRLQILRRLVELYTRQASAATGEPMRWRRRDL